MKVNTVVICAAGLGSRLGLDTPKCLVNINNKPLIYYLLQNLKNVENIRVVVGFKEEEVINYVRSIREDVVFVRNSNYVNTSNSYSLYLGSYDLKEPFISIDGDMFLDKENFTKFYEATEAGENLVAITKSYTEDAVYVQLNETKQVVGFTRSPKTEYEWTGIACFYDIKINKDGKYVYQELEDKLPINTIDIVSYEIDTPKDLEVLSNNSNLFQ